MLVAHINTVYFMNNKNQLEENYRHTLKTLEILEHVKCMCSNRRSENCGKVLD